ncbi:hypothetical protein [Saccharothrix hoggarensis]|uniref:Type VII secretion system (Wss) protein ESAT-6 n=1 Tax=Saccharothrix hoggarensis TaxID=913853 RepID=A0ABW3QY02_9PSEU
MTGYNGGLTGDVGQYALKQYREQSGGGLASLFTMGLSDVVAAAKALAAANEAKALAVDPQAVDTMLKKLTDMQDVLDGIQADAEMLASQTPLGGGYAEDIGKVNAQLGHQVINEVIPEMVKAIADLKDQVDKSRASYRNVDEAKSETFNNL